jgi:hypothetical protein
MAYTVRKIDSGDTFMERFKYYFLAAIPVLIFIGAASRVVPCDTPFAGFVYGAVSITGMVGLKNKIKQHFTL